MKTKGTQGSGCQPRICQVTTSYGNIDAFINDIDQPVIEIKIKFNFGVLCSKCWQHRQQHPVCHNGQADAQFAARAGRHADDLGLGIVDVCEYTQAALIKQLAFSSQADVAGAAV